MSLFTFLVDTIFSLRPKLAASSRTIFNAELLLDAVLWEISGHVVDSWPLVFRIVVFSIVVSIPSLPRKFCIIRATWNRPRNPVCSARPFHCIEGIIFILLSHFQILATVEFKSSFKKRLWRYDKWLNCYSLYKRCTALYIYIYIYSSIYLPSDGVTNDIRYVMTKKLERIFRAILRSSNC